MEFVLLILHGSSCAVKMFKKEENEDNDIKT